MTTRPWQTCCRTPTSMRLQRRGCRWTARECCSGRPIAASWAGSTGRSHLRSEACALELLRSEARTPQLRRAEAR
eukprot:12583458-Heterocapsa_arctica.AAC.1